MCRNPEHTLVGRQQYWRMSEAADSAGNGQHEEGLVATSSHGQLCKLHRQLLAAYLRSSISISAMPASP